MNGGGRPGGPPAFRPPPPGRPDARSILPIGATVVLRSTVAGTREVGLYDEDGYQRVGAVSVATEVEITAWRPKAAWATRYRVRTGDGIEGWVEAGNVEARPMPAPPQRAPTPAPVAKAKPRAAAAQRQKKK